MLLLFLSKSALFNQCNKAKKNGTSYRRFIEYVIKLTVYRYQSLTLEVIEGIFLLFNPGAGRWGVHKQGGNGDPNGTYIKC